MQARGSGTLPAVPPHERRDAPRLEKLDRLRLADREGVRVDGSRRPEILQYCVGRGRVLAPPPGPIARPPPGSDNAQSRVRSTVPGEELRVFAEGGGPNRCVAVGDVVGPVYKEDCLAGITPQQ
eukprot:1363694-Rhodomonas_salina.1